MSKISKLLVMLILVGGLSTVSTGCVVGVSEPAEPTVNTSYYTPMYYNGAVVYYSAAGLPYYYLNGAAVYIPRTYYGYNRYYSHWSANRVYYSRWYRARGHRYRSYRTRNYRRSHRRGHSRTRGKARGTRRHKRR